MTLILFDFDKFYIFGYDSQTIKIYLYKDDNFKIILHDNNKKNKLFINEFEHSKLFLTYEWIFINVQTIVIREYLEKANNYYSFIELDLKIISYEKNPEAQKKLK